MEITYVILVSSLFKKSQPQIIYISMVANLCELSCVTDTTAIEFPSERFGRMLTFKGILAGLTDYVWQSPVNY